MRSSRSARVSPSSLHVGPGLHQLRDLRLAVADQKSVDEGRHRLAVGCRRAPRDDQRVGVRPLVGSKGNFPKLKNLQDVRVGQLVLQREPHDVELVKRSRTFERAQRLVVRAELPFHVVPDGIRALREKVGALIDHVVEDLVPEVAHPDLVQIGESEAHAARDVVPDLAHFSLLPTQVLSWLVHSIDEGRVGVLLHGQFRRDSLVLGRSASAARGVGPAA